MSQELWQIPAKHETTCPKCLGKIKLGQWIVHEPGQQKWQHAVCPIDMKSQYQFGKGHRWHPASSSDRSSGGA